MIQDHSVEGGNPDQCFGFEPLYRIKNSIQVHLGHEDDGAAHQKSAQSTGLAQDMKKRRRAQNYIFLRFEQGITDGNLLSGRFQVQSVGNGNTLGEFGGTAGIDDLRDVFALLGERRQGLGARVSFYHISEPIGVIFLGYLPFGHPIKSPAKKLFPPWQKVRELYGNGFLEVGFGDCLFHITEIGIGTDNVFRAAVIGDIDQVMFCINGRDGHHHGAGPLYAQPGHHPVYTIGNIEDYPLPFRHTRISQ